MEKKPVDTTRRALFDRGRDRGRRRRRGGGGRPVHRTMTPSAKRRRSAPGRDRYQRPQARRTDHRKMAGQTGLGAAAHGGDAGRYQRANAELSDPESGKSAQPDYAKNEFRARKAEFLVVLGICTHLAVRRPISSRAPITARRQTGRAVFSAPATVRGLTSRAGYSRACRRPPIL